jgi:putative ABC transport system permease protein
MNIWRAGLKSVRHRPLNSGLSILLLAFGLGLIMVLLSAQSSFEQAFTRNIRGIDMVVGAKGSPLQLILSSVYHVDAPTGNIKLEEFEKLSRNPMIAKAIPLAYGDNYRGFRIVGTDSNYTAHYEVDIAQGRQFQQVMEVCLGAEVAAVTNLKIGDHFHGSHGFEEEGEHHDHRDFEVVGIYAPSGTVIDKLITTPVNSVWAVHDHGGEDHHHEDGSHHHPPKEITAGLLSFGSPMATLSLPRMVNKNTNMQAALPAIEVNRLFTLADSAIQFLNALGLLLLILAALSVFASMYQSLKDEQPQLAFLRAMGTPRIKIMTLVLVKALILSVLGFVGALLLSQMALWLITDFIAGEYQYDLAAKLWSTENLYLFGAVLALSLVAGAIPALQAYRLNIVKTLANA